MYHTVASGENSVNHASVDVRQSPFDSVVVVGELFVVDSEEMKDGCVKVVPGGDVSLGLPSVLIGFAVGNSGLKSAAGHPDTETILVVIASGSQDTAVGLCEWSAAEFTGEQHQGVIQKARPPEISQERGERLVAASRDCLEHGQQFRLSCLEVLGRAARGGA